MKLITRKPRKEIVIGGIIRISYVEADEGTAHVRVVAPLHVSVVREELQEDPSKSPDPDSRGELVLGRKAGGMGIVIDGNIIVRILTARPKRVKFGVSAPYGTLIQREEEVSAPSESTTQA